MRNQIARVILGAFFCVASATTQGPATSSGAGIQLGAGTSIAHGQHPSGVLDTQYGGSASGSSHSYASGSYDRGSSFRVRSLHSTGALQDQKPYSLTRLFRQHHGEFLDRHERFDPQFELRARFLPNQRVGDEPGDFDLLGYDVDIETPAIITTEAYLLFGLYHYGRHYSTSSAFGTANNATPNVNRESSFGDETLTAAGARLGIGWFLDENFLMEVQTNPGVYSDLENSLGHKDYDFPSSALFTYRPTDNFFFKFGARYNQIYEDAPWLPYLGFSWEITDGLRFDLLAPEYFELSFWPSAATSFAFGAEVSGAQYRVHSSLATGKQEANVQVQEVIAYLGLTHRFSDMISLQARGGIVLAGEYDLTTGAESATSPANRFDRTEGALDQGFYADVTFGINW